MTKTFQENLRDEIRDKLEQSTGIIGQAMRAKRRDADRYEQTTEQVEQIESITTRIKDNNATLTSIETSFVQITKNFQSILLAVKAKNDLIEPVPLPPVARHDKPPAEVQIAIQQQKQDAQDDTSSTFRTLGDLLGKLAKVSKIGKLAKGALKSRKGMKALVGGTAILGAGAAFGKTKQEPLPDDDAEGDMSTAELSKQDAQIIIDSGDEFLIEQFGGIERLKSIAGGAPSGKADYNVTPSTQKPPPAATTTAPSTQPDVIPAPAYGAPVDVVPSSGPPVLVAPPITRSTAPKPAAGPATGNPPSGVVPPGNAPLSSPSGSASGAAPTPAATGAIPSPSGPLTEFTKIDNNVDVDSSKINPELYKRVTAMAEAYKNETGKKLLITSGYRDNAKQKELFDAKVAQLGGDVAAARKMVAEPMPPLGAGKGSPHLRGLALDINSKGDGGINALAGSRTSPTGWLERFGLIRPVPNEDWHIQLAGSPPGADNPNNPGAPIQVVNKQGQPAGPTSAAAQPVPTDPKTGQSLLDTSKSVAQTKQESQQRGQTVIVSKTTTTVQKPGGSQTGTSMQMSQPVG